MSIAKSTRAARGTVQCENTSLNLLKANDFVAEQIRKQMTGANTLLVNITSSAGSGKTTLLAETVRRLKDEFNIFTMVGDLETERDADRLREAGGNARQIVTGGICHLEAQMVHQVVETEDIASYDLIFVENVGNLVCPASFDLGEDYRVTLMATTEGDDKPKKYPRMFVTSDLMLVSKADLLPYLPFSVDKVVQDARDLNPEIEVIQISTTQGEGIDVWCDWLRAKVKAKQAQAAATV